MWTYAPVDTFSDSLAQLEGKPLGDKLALMLAKAVVNKLSEILAVEIVKKVALHWELEEGRGVGKKSLRQAEQKVETLGHTLAKVKVR